MFPCIQDVADSNPLRFARILALQQLSEPEDRIQWRAQFVTDTRQKFILGFVRPFYFLHSFAVRYVFNRALVVDDCSGSIADGPGILANPNLALVLPINFIFEQLNKPLLLNQALEFTSPLR